MALIERTIKDVEVHATLVNDPFRFQSRRVKVAKTHLSYNAPITNLNNRKAD